MPREGNDSAGTTQEAASLNRRNLGAEAPPDEKITPLGSDEKKLFEGSGQGTRGSLTLPADGYGTGDHVMNLFAARDKSTMLHEGAHDEPSREA